MSPNAVNPLDAKENESVKKLVFLTALFLLYLGVVSAAQAGLVPLNEENFPDAAFRDYLRERDFYDPSANTVDTDAVGDINVSNIPIESLKGIELFTELTRLNCVICGLQGELDVRACTKLKHLNCSINQLSSLNVDGCSNLEQLHCYRFVFTKKWTERAPKSLDWTMYDTDGKVLSRKFNKTVVSPTEWRYETFLAADTGCYVIEHVPAGYTVQ